MIKGREGPNYSTPLMRNRYNVILTPELIWEIRDRYAKGTISQRQLQKELNGRGVQITQAHISYIVNRKRWPTV